MDLLLSVYPSILRRERFGACLDLDSGLPVSGREAECDEELEEERICPQSDICTAGCVVSEWSSWTACSASCGGGVSLRRRTVLQEPEPGGLTCPGPLDQHTACNTNSLPDCPAGQVFSSCAGSCLYSCEDLWPENQCVPLTCSPGCSCSPGAVMLNGSCVPQSQCPCSVVSLLLASRNLILDLQEQGSSCGNRHTTLMQLMLLTSTDGSGQQFFSRTIRRQRQEDGSVRGRHTLHESAGAPNVSVQRMNAGSGVSPDRGECVRGGCLDLYGPEPLNCTGPGATEGCVCEEGRYRSLEGRCVIPALCQCEEEDGTLREPGFEWMDGCQSCRCINGQKHCQSNCPPLHSSEGEVKVLEVESCCPVCRREYPEDPVAECRLH